MYLLYSEPTSFGVRFWYSPGFQVSEYVTRSALGDTSIYNYSSNWHDYTLLLNQAKC
jgi:hypothetical protein